jgi:hypothetical protein
MEKKFIIPAVTMLAGLVTWIVLFVLFGFGTGEAAWSSLLIIGLAVAAVGLISISGFSCRQVGGPRAGLFFRSGILLLMAILTWWKIGILMAGLLLVASLAMGVLALVTPDPNQVAEKSTGGAEAESH